MKKLQVISQKRSIKIILKAMLCMILSFMVACASSDKKDTESAEYLFEKAQELVKDERFEEAIRKLQDIKNKFPYSKLAVDAELLIADSYFNQESFPEAQASYQLFKELHPKHIKMDYVTYKIGLSFFNQLPSTIDRDLSLANQAISTFEIVLKDYSKSEFVQDSLKKKVECLKMLAEKEIYIANFYFKKNNFDSAVKRYKNSLLKFGNSGFNLDSKNNAIESAKKINNEELIKDFSSIIIEDSHKN